MKLITFSLLNFQTSVAEAEDKAKFAEESKAQLKFEKSILMDKVTTLQRSVEKLEGKLHKTHKEEVKLMKVSEKSLAFICTLLL